MKNKLLTFMEKHQLLAKNSTVLAGVSGGPDSMALLHFLASIREGWGLKLTAVTIDHRLRQEESEEDAEYVEAKCKDWGIPCVRAALDVPAYKKEKQIGTQLAARKMRYGFFREEMKTLDADYLALGHHADDQIETMLMEMIRTADSAAFKGIPAKRKFAEGYIIRPLLAVSREEILAYCKKEGISPRFDPSNEQTIYTRNYIRKYILPLIKEINPNIHTTVQHLSNTLQADENYLQEQAAQVVEKVVNFHPDEKKVSVSAEELKTYPYALQRRTYHLILNYLYVKLPKDLSYIHEEYFFTLLHSAKSNILIDFPSQLKLEKSYDRLIFYFLHSFPEDNSYHRTLEIPGKTSLPDGTCIRTELVGQYEDMKENIFICSLEDIALPLYVRTRKPGDRMTWKGLNGSKKLKDIFIDAKIPASERDVWPVLTDHKGVILWLIGLKKGQPVNGSGGAPYVKIHYEHRSQEV